MVFRHLRRSLFIWPLIRRAVISDDIRLNRFRAFDKVGHIDHQIALNREVGQRFDLQPFGIIAQEGLQASLGTLLTIMPQEPQIAMRHDQR